jgi:regulator of sigma E protease
MLTVVAFIVALGLLIAVHEYGHYRVAVACGVRVLRFSVGFGKTLYRWQPKNQKHGQTPSLSSAPFPLGGYVKMLDEREAPWPPSRAPSGVQHPAAALARRHRGGRPAANLLLAVLLYALVNWYGVQEPRAVLASPVAGSVAEAAGLRGRAGAPAGFDRRGAGAGGVVRELRWLLTRGALDGGRARWRCARRGGASTREVVLAAVPPGNARRRRALFRRIGIVGPLDAARDGRGDARRRRRARRPAQGDVVLTGGRRAVVDDGPAARADPRRRCQRARAGSASGDGARRVHAGAAK